MGLFRPWPLALLWIVTLASLPYLAYSQLHDARKDIDVHPAMVDEDRPFATGLTGMCTLVPASRPEIDAKARSSAP